MSSPGLARDLELSSASFRAVSLFQGNAARPTLGTYSRVLVGQKAFTSRRGSVCLCVMRLYVMRLYVSTLTPQSSAARRRLL